VLSNPLAGKLVFKRNMTITKLAQLKSRTQECCHRPAAPHPNSLITELPQFLLLPWGLRKNT